MATKNQSIEDQILAALGHVEGEEGLYFNNLVVVHEEEDRPVVLGEDTEVRSALKNLLKAGTITSVGEGDTTIYRLSGNN